MVKQFEVIDHTADIGVVAYGTDLGALFRNAAAGMLSLMMKSGGQAHDVTRAISLAAEDNETLLIEWLNELLYIIYTEKLALHGFDIVVKGGQLRAECTGERLGQGGPVITREIKAATYHNLEIVHKEGTYSVRIIFDI